jgi:hypothetical protein
MPFEIEILCKNIFYVKENAEHRLRVFENRLLRRKEGTGTGGELHNLQYSWVFKSKRI